MKKTRRIITLMLSVVMVLSLLPSRVIKADVEEEVVKTATIQVESQYAKPGKEVEVNVSIKDNPGILGAVLTISYDDQKMELVKVENGDAFSSLVMTSPGKFTNNSTFSWDGQDLNEEDIMDGKILQMYFRIADDAPIGENYDVNIQYNSRDFVDSDLNLVKVKVENGTINVLDYIPGDLDDDGKITLLDVISLRRHVVGNYEQNIIEAAGDVNSDGRWNSTDVIMLRRFIAGGYGIKLKPAGENHIHSMSEKEESEATCIRDGNIAYWYCVDCNTYYKDKDGLEEIELNDTVIPAKGHTVVIDKAVPPTATNTGLTEGSHCSVCNEVLKKQIVIDKTNGYSITYNISNGDTYLAQQIIDNSNNPVEYTSEQDTIVLDKLTAPQGYRFLGWFDGAGDNAVEVKEIKKGTTGKIQLYAHWEEIVYDVTYKLYQTPLAPISDEKFLHYTVSKGLVDLPNPTLYNYVFLGWYDNDGKEVTRINPGKTGDIELNAYWTSKRNLTKAVKKLEDPVIVENPDEGKIYFTYEIGSIENVPLSDAIWTIQSVAGLAQQTSKTVTTSITDEQADNIMNSISKATVDSKTWTLSSNWNDTTTVNESWAETNSMTQEEAITKAKTSSNTFSITSMEGGNETTTTTDGTTTLTYNSKTHTSESGKDTVDEKGSHLDVGVDINYSREKEKSKSGLLKVGIPIGDVEIGGNKTKTTKFEIGGNVDYGIYEKQTTTKYGKKIDEKHTGSDTTKVDTTVKNETSSWNNEQSASSTQSASESRTVSNVLSNVISNTKSYGKSYAYGGENSESLGLSNSSSESMNTSSTLAYSKSETTTTTTTYSTDGKSEGCYRLVIAGTVHVFAIVGYDVATKSYFTYTYNVMDDKTYEFLDYSPSNKFDDCPNGAIPFEVPIYVKDYVDSRIVKTEGLEFITNSEDGTATLKGYNGVEQDVVVPSYISAGKKSYKVTEMDSTAFAGKDIHAVILSDYIDVVPDSAFEGCEKLEMISGRFTHIGECAFKGCISMDKFNVSSSMKEIGANAFEGVNHISVEAPDAATTFELAKEANPELDENVPEELNELEINARDITQKLTDDIVQSGAKNISLNISTIIEGTELQLDVPAIDSFELVGGKKLYKNLSLNSSAEQTVIKEITVTECKKIPFDIASGKLTLEEVSATNDSFVLLLEKDGVEVTLIRDSKLISNNGKAIVCKNPTIYSAVVDSTLGVLKVSGNIYKCGSLTGRNDIDLKNGEIISISEDEFDKYIKGVFKVSFDANGGSVEDGDKTTYYGEKLGILPTPTRTNCEFAGWYTSDGNKITEDTIYTFSNDLTLRAHWVSDWTNEENLPDDATVTAEKWTYDLTTKITSSNSSVDGYTLYDSSWVWGPYGSWSGWSTNYVAGSDSRQVETNYHAPQYITQWNYSRYSSNSNNTGKLGPARDYWGGVYCQYYFERGWGDRLSVSSTQTSSKYGTFNLYGNNQWFNESSRQVCTQNEYTEYRYRDRSKVYTYYLKKVEQKESSTKVESSDSISNVKRWVQYVIK